MIRFLTLMIFFVAGSLADAQTLPDSTATLNSLTSGSITSQFEYIYRVSNNFQEYEVVKKSNLEQLKSNVLDSLRTLGAQLEAVESAQAGHSDTLTKLTEAMNQAQLEMQVALEAQDSFLFLGMTVQKTVFSSLMWILVLLLAGGMVFFAVQYFRSFGRITKAEKDLSDVQEEFEQHRKNTLERERKLKRELIDAQLGKK